LRAADAERYASITLMESHHSESMDTEIADETWPFDQAPNVAALTTRQVIEQNLPILMVTHYSDDDSWAFVCGTTGDYENDGRLICMADALGRDSSLRRIADLPPGWSAERDDVDSEWIRYRDSDA
jgi:hypothetical protein